MKMYSLLGLAVVALVCAAPPTASAEAPKSARARSISDLAALQPPPTGNGPDRFGIAVNCRPWSADQAALEECSKDLDLIKGLGVGTIRLGVGWDFMSQDSTLDPKKVAFTKALLAAARVRGMKILFQVGMLAPPGAYRCAGVVNPPAQSSPRLDFCDAIFSRYLSALMDVVLPYTADIELFNELNWGFKREDPSYGDANGILGYIPKREKTIYIEAKRILDSKKRLGYKAVLHSQGISYFYNSAYPNDGWTPPDNAPFIQATDLLKAIGNHAASASSPLNAVVDVVDIHPYFNSGVLVAMMQSIIDTLAALTPNGTKSLWITETNNGSDGTDAGMTASFNQLKVLMDRNAVQEVFWFAIRNGDPDNGEGDRYAIYSYHRDLIRPQLAAAIKAYTATVPASKRFLSGAYLAPIR
jgi:Glycosyl hydrolase catalytic core